jgi:hypothetical protein
VRYDSSVASLRRHGSTTQQEKIMFKVKTNYSATGERGGYVLQWQGPNKPTHIVGNNNTCCWYKYKHEAEKACGEQNRALIEKLSMSELEEHFISSLSDNQWKFLLGVEA